MDNFYVYLQPYPPLRTRLRCNTTILEQPTGRMKSNPEFHKISLKEVAREVHRSLDSTLTSFEVLINLFPRARHNKYNLTWHRRLLDMRSTLPSTKLTIASLDPMKSHTLSTARPAPRPLSACRACRQWRRREETWKMEYLKSERMVRKSITYIFKTTKIPACAKTSWRSLREFICTQVNKWVVIKCNLLGRNVYYFYDDMFWAQAHGPHGVHEGRQQFCLGI